MTAEIIKKDLLAVADDKKKQVLERFFKIGKGEYGEGDIFLGVAVPLQREIVKQHAEIPIQEIEKLLKENIHEYRLTGLLFLTAMFNRSEDEAERKSIYDFYIDHADRINNWDLVDLTAPNIVGEYLWDKDRSDLIRFATTDHLWLQRIAIVSTYYFIKKGDIETTFEISDLLISHKHDLIHKANGWMLREAGKRDFDFLYDYLTHESKYKTMPRTMLRYAIEKFPETLRLKILRGTI